MKTLRARGVGTLLSVAVALFEWPAAGFGQAPGGAPATPPASSAPAHAAEKATEAAAGPESAPTAGIEADTAVAPTAAAPGTEAGAGTASPTDAGTAESAASPGPAAAPDGVSLSSPGADAGAAEVPAPSGALSYVLERIEIRGNSTSASAIEHYVPIEPGEPFEVDDPTIERIRFRLMGTGWFDDVKLRLERGSRRGWVVLVIEVVERNTLRITRVVAGFSRVVTSSRSRDDELRPYGGLGVTESNLFGLGTGVGASVVGSEQQLGVDLRYHDPMLAGSRFSLSGRAFYNHAREFFGRDPIVAISCPEPDPSGMPSDPCDPDVSRERAVVIYDRGGVGIGTGHDLSVTWRYEIDWLGELVDVGTKPRAASTRRGDEYAPIDFLIDDGQSIVSSLRFALVVDRRDDPALPSRGQLASLEARYGSSLFGSSYDFGRIETNLRHWAPLPWGHVLSLGAMAGTVVGRAPFFYRFYAADLSDLLPSRVLELNLDHRHTHNLLGTSIVEYDKAELAARIDFEYQLPLHRGGGAVRGVDAYAGAGLFFLAERDALRAGIEGYEGFAAVPIDVTFDLGVQADTSLGLFKLGFSSFIGFLPDLGREGP